MADRTYRGEAEATPEPAPAALLTRAANARSAASRAKYATAGLVRVGGDGAMQAMLLRQLYLAHMEAGRFEQALDAARNARKTAEMPDVAAQDLARALLATGRRLDAITELRCASRCAPASRRSFHLWSLGSLLYLSQQPELAAVALAKAERWGTTARPLYSAQLALARVASGASTGGLERLRCELAVAPCGQGYGRFVLGDLAHAMGDFQAAQAYLQDFVSDVSGGRRTRAVGLSAELQRAQALLGELEGWGPPSDAD